MIDTNINNSKVQPYDLLPRLYDPIFLQRISFGAARATLRAEAQGRQLSRTGSAELYQEVATFLVGELPANGNGNISSAELASKALGLTPEEATACVEDVALVLGGLAQGVSQAPEAVIMAAELLDVLHTQLLDSSATF